MVGGEGKSKNKLNQNDVNIFISVGSARIPPAYCFVWSFAYWGWFRRRMILYPFSVAILLVFRIR